MAGLDDLPQDLRESLPGVARVQGALPRELPSGKSFIGGKSADYPGGRPPDRQLPPLEAEAPVVEDKGEPCVRCAVPVKKDQNFCASCGYDFHRRTAAADLGIEISTEDIASYIFTGYLTKGVELVKGHTATFKSLQSKEVEEAEELVRQRFKEADPTQVEWQNFRAKLLLAFGWAKLDGESLGKSAKERLEWIQERGAHLVDLASKKFALFNNAITEVLNSDALKNS